MVNAAFDERARREALRWWLSTFAIHFGIIQDGFYGAIDRRWRPIPTSSGDEVEGFSDDKTRDHIIWASGLQDVLVPLKLMRCRSLIEVGYASTRPHNIRCVAAWSGEDWLGGICQQLVDDRLWPETWPDDTRLIAFDRSDWHLAWPSSIIDDNGLISMLSKLPMEEQFETFEAVCADGPPFDTDRIEIECAYIDGKRMPGGNEEDLRTDFAAEPLMYTLGEQEVPTAGNRPCSTDDKESVEQAPEELRMGSRCAPHFKKVPPFGPRVRPETKALVTLFRTEWTAETNIAEWCRKYAISVGRPDWDCRKLLHDYLVFSD